jgi:hypothetical protein
MAKRSGGLGLSRTEESSKGTGRQQSKSLFPTEFLTEMHKTVGGPLTVNDMFTLSPRGHSLFGNAPTQAQRPGGGYSLGFGAPTSATAPAAPPPGAAPAPSPGGEPGGPTPASTLSGQGTSTRRYSLSDLESQYVEDPDKVMDLPRLLKKSGLDPSGFSYDDLEQAISKAKKYGFSGRSRGNFARVLGGLQRGTALEETLGGGKGTGIF